MAKVSQSKEDLQKQLDEQLELLKQLCELYDNGSAVIAKSIATSIRVLLHDTTKSRSLLGQLGIKMGLFYNTAEVIEEDKPGVMRAGSFSALLGISFGQGGEGYVPYLDNMPGRTARQVDFNAFWDEVIFIDHDKNTFTRKEVVLYVANQDGGSHVDPDLDEKYVQLSRKNSLGWLVGNDKEWTELSGAELASIRQIAHEVLKTFAPNYEPVDVMSKTAAVMGGGGFMLHFGSKEKDEPVIPRKQPCPCGSGKKYKRCHGKTVI